MIFQTNLAQVSVISQERLNDYNRVRCPKGQVIPAWMQKPCRRSASDVPLASPPQSRNTASLLRHLRGRRLGCPRSLRSDPGRCLHRPQLSDRHPVQAWG